MAKKSPLLRAKEKAIAEISRYVRLSAADEFGMCECVTCGKRYHWKQIQAGHFIPAAEGNATRFLLENIHPQCMRCNVNLGGNAPEYYPYMVKRYGEDFVEALKAKRHTVVKLKEWDYLDMVETYKALNSPLLEKLG